MVFLFRFCKVSCAVKDLDFPSEGIGILGDTAGIYQILRE